jgi:stearoyl-CoA desaturase (delta-9 desaturase)
MTTPISSSRPQRRWFREQEIDYFSLSQFLLLHFACLLVFWVSISWTASIVCVMLYVIRLFGITAGYHRYFSHRSFKTGRLVQFILAFIGASAYEKGPLWWAANHRSHHMYADTDEDVHSPLQGGFWWSHCGWFLCRKNNETKLDLIPNLMKYPELRFLDRFFALPPLLLATLVFALGVLLGRYAPCTNTNGLQMLVWGFFINTVLVHHATFTVTSFAHMFGKRRFQTDDTSRNNLMVALLTLGEGWHNNHHYYPASERQGFYWWELDLTHYILKAFALLGIVWDLKTPPLRVYEAAKASEPRVEPKLPQSRLPLALPNQSYGETRIEWERIKST